MALPIKIQYTIRDEEGLVARTLVHLPTATTLSAATTFAASFGGLIDAVTGGVLESIDVCIGVSLPGGIKTTPDSGSDIEEGAQFVYEDADGRIFRQRLPTFLESLIVAGTRQVDNSNAAVQGVTDAIVTGLAGTAPVTLAGTDITAMVSDKEQFVKNRKGRRT